MTITPALLELGADALRAEAGRRRRAAEVYAGEVRAEKLAGSVRDVRTPAVKVLDELGIAAGLEELAAHIGELADYIPADEPDLVDPVPLVELLERILERIDPGGEDVSVGTAAAEGAVAILDLLDLEAATTPARQIAELPLELAAPLADPDVAAARSALQEHDGVDPIDASA